MVAKVGTSNSDRTISLRLQYLKKHNMGLKPGRWHWGKKAGCGCLRIFGPTRGEVKKEWRKLHNEKLNDLYSSPIILRVIKSRRMRWAGHVARMGERWDVYRVLVGKPEGKRPIVRPRRRWEDKIKMDLQWEYWPDWSDSGGEANTGFWWGNLRESDYLGDPGIDGRIILRWIFRKWDVGVWTGSS